MIWKEARPSSERPASVPPVIIMSARPARTIIMASPMALPAEAQAVLMVAL